jgi:hypothetical protein
LNETERYLESKGWVLVLKPVVANSKIRLTFWRDPINPLKERWRHEAVYVQKSRESLVRRIMES